MHCQPPIIFEIIAAQVNSTICLYQLISSKVIWKCSIIHADFLFNAKNQISFKNDDPNGASYVPLDPRREELKNI